MTRADAVLIVVCFLAAAVAAVWFAFGNREGQRLQVSCDGQVIINMPLMEKSLAGVSEDGGEMRYCLILLQEDDVSCKWYEAACDPAAAVPEGTSYNLLVLSENGVAMEAADCRDQICVNHRPVSRGGESIICLPHRLVVEIAGGTDESVPDGVAKAGHIIETAREKGRQGHETDG